MSDKNIKVANISFYQPLIKHWNKRQHYQATTLFSNCLLFEFQHFEIGHMSKANQRKFLGCLHTIDTFRTLERKTFHQFFPQNKTNTKETANKQTTKQENNTKHWQIVVVLWNQSHSSVYSSRTGGSTEKNYSKYFEPLSLGTKKGVSV